jgi:hypothetical protein
MPHARATTQRFSVPAQEVLKDTYLSTKVIHSLGLGVGLARNRTRGGIVTIAYTSHVRRWHPSNERTDGRWRHLLVDLSEELVVAEERVLLLSDLEGRATELNGEKR